MSSVYEYWKPLRENCIILTLGELWTFISFRWWLFCAVLVNPSFLNKFCVPLWNKIPGRRLKEFWDVSNFFCTTINILVICYRKWSHDITEKAWLIRLKQITVFACCSYVTCDYNYSTEKKHAFQYIFTMVWAVAVSHGVHVVNIIDLYLPARYTD